MSPDGWREPLVADLGDGIEYRRLLEHLEAQFPLPTASIHGPAHWARVASHGAFLAARTPGCDPTVARLFALFHDCRRENDHRDDGHGRRGAELARDLRGRLFNLDDARLALLVAACDGHTDGRVSDDPTVGACWDSDRLDLGRCGMTPAARLMSTAAARDPETIRRAIELSQQGR